MGRFRAAWLLCLGATVAAFLATMIPLLGILFNLLGAQALPILTLNLAFALMAADGLASRLWLLLVPPLLWFGGYGAAAAISHIEVAHLRAAAGAANAQAVRWDRARQPVLIAKTDTSSENMASDITPSDLVQTYGLDEAYAGSFADAPASRVWLDRHDCPGPGAGIADGIDFGHFWRGMYPARGPMQAAQGVCLLTRTSAAAPASALVVALGPVRQMTGLIDGIEQDITISGPGQPATTLRAVQVAPLPWLPMPMLGCHYKGGFGDYWDHDCHAEFTFDSWRGQDAATPMALVARVLGLKAMTIEQRLPGVGWK